MTAQIRMHLENRVDLSDTRLVERPIALRDMGAGQGGWVRRRMARYSVEVRQVCWLDADELVWPAQVSPLPADMTLAQDPLDAARGQIERSAFVYRTERAFHLVFPEGKNQHLMGAGWLPIEPLITLYAVIGLTEDCPGAYIEAATT